MRVPLEWLAELVDLSAEADPHALAADLASIGLEEEDFFGPDVVGPLVAARVLSLEKEEHSNGKTINWCSVDTGEGDPRGIVCGAHNFVAGDLVVAALPGAVLPGDFAIAARKTYGHVSDGMICSTKELGLGEDHDGIIVLPELGLDAEPGDDAIGLLGLDHVTLDVNVTPDRGYQLSMRGIGREYAQLRGQDFADPATLATVPAGEGFPVLLGDAAPLHGHDGCDRFTALVVRGIDPVARTPYWMAKRLLEAGMRSISLTVDVSNYVMLELGQPNHAYDLSKLGERIVVRRARAGETLVTLDGVTRKLDPEDLLITDETAGESRIIGLAGVMGGAELEVGTETTDVLIESAHFDPVSIARSSRRHKLSSEASRRNERGVDPHLGPVAAARVAALLAELGGGTVEDLATEVGGSFTPAAIDLPAARPAAVVGVDYSAEESAALLRGLGAEVAIDGENLSVVPPSWRPDLVLPIDLVEEIARLGGYGRIPSVVPESATGNGLSPIQRARRRASNLLASLGLTEVLTYPFTSEARHDELGLPADDPRRATIRLANPLAEDAPLMRSHLLATLVDAAVRNLGRGHRDVALFEAGLVTVPDRDLARPGPRFPPGYHPSPEELRAIFDSVPPQPFHVAGVLMGQLEPRGSWGGGRRVEAADAIELVHRIAAAHGTPARPEQARRAPFHPGRAAEFTLESGAILGHAGELHPKVAETLGLPPRTVAFEIDLGTLASEPDARQWSGVLSTYPVSRQDVALIVDESVPAGEVAATLREGAGDVLEELEVFDVFRGEQVGEGRKSIAFRMTFRAPDRTLTADEASGLRVAASDLAAARHGAQVRS